MFIAKNFEDFKRKWQRNLGRGVKAAQNQHRKKVFRLWDALEAPLTFTLA